MRSGIPTLVSWIDFIVNPADDEQLALALNGKKKKIKDADFERAFETSGVLPVVFRNIKKKYIRLLPKMLEAIDKSFLDDEQKEKYKEMLTERLR